MNRHPLRLIRNIRRIVDVTRASRRSIKFNKSKKMYLVPGLHLSYNCHHFG